MKTKSHDKVKSYDITWRDVKQNGDGKQEIFLFHVADYFVFLAPRSGSIWWWGCSGLNSWLVHRNPWNLCLSWSVRTEKSWERIGKTMILDAWTMCIDLDVMDFHLDVCCVSCYLHWETCVCVWTVDCISLWQKPLTFWANNENEKQQKKRTSKKIDLWNTKTNASEKAIDFLLEHQGIFSGPTGTHEKKYIYISLPQQRVVNVFTCPLIWKKLQTRTSQWTLIFVPLTAKMSLTIWFATVLVLWEVGLTWVHGERGWCWGWPTVVQKFTRFSKW